MSAPALSGKVKALLAAHTISICGLGSQVVVLALVALERYGSATALAVLAVARAAGLVAGYPAAGWVTARYGALRVAAATHTTFALWAGTLGVLALTTAPIWALAAVTFIAGAAMAADSPARRAGVADLAGGSAPAAMSWLATSTWVGRLGGAAAGAAAWAVAPWAAFAFNAATYLLPAALYATWSAASPPAAHPPARPQPLRALAAIRAHRDATRVLAAAAVSGIAIEFGVLAALLVDGWGTGAVGLSTLEACAAAGAVAAGLYGARRHSTDHTRATGAGWVFAALGAAALAAPAFWAAAVALAAYVAGVTYAYARTSTVLVALDDTLRGDALASFGVLQWATSAAAAPLLVAAATVGPWALAATSATAMAAAATLCATGTAARTADRPAAAT